MGWAAITFQGAAAQPNVARAITSPVAAAQPNVAHATIVHAAMADLKED